MKVCKICRKWISDDHESSERRTIRPSKTNLVHYRCNNIINKKIIPLGASSIFLLIFGIVFIIISLSFGVSSALGEELTITFVTTGFILIIVSIILYFYTKKEYLKIMDKNS